MPLASSAAIIGPKLATAAGSTDPIGIGAWASIGAVICGSPHGSKSEGIIMKSDAA